MDRTAVPFAQLQKMKGQKYFTSKWTLYSSGSQPIFSLKGAVATSRLALRWDMREAGTELKRGTGEHVFPNFWPGGGQHLLSPQHFLIKNNVVVQISRLHYCCKSPA